jgi:hypothetical protein
LLILLRNSLRLRLATCECEQGDDQKYPHGNGPKFLETIALVSVADQQPSLFPVEKIAAYACPRPSPGVIARVSANGFVASIRPANAAKDIDAAPGRVHAPCNAAFRLGIGVNLGAVLGLDGHALTCRARLRDRGLDGG